VFRIIKKYEHEYIDNPAVSDLVSFHFVQQLCDIRGFVNQIVTSGDQSEFAFSPDGDGVIQRLLN